MDVYSNLVSLLKEKGLTIGFAESLTGGLFASKIANVSGASSVLCGGVVSYTNDVKINVLKVKKETIDKYTEVSYECASEMAKGLKELLKCDIAISLTGIAGPTGGTEKNPVGTVYCGFFLENSLYSIRLCFPNTLSRNEIREAVCLKIAKMLVKKFTKRY
ncbi:MAG: CinA family protein [Clostridia bacterium]|nr:CinA family protein [Clostridia bacterium]